MKKDNEKSQDYSSNRSQESETMINMNNLLLKNGYINKDAVGKGTHSVVRRAYSKRQQKDVALKIVDKRESNFSSWIIQSEAIVCIVEEYAGGGDLLMKVKKLGRIDEIDAKFYYRQLVEALMYLKQVEVVHRDLKCENLFLDIYDNIKLGDFGFSRKMRKGEESRTFCGSRAYVAPEVLRSRAYSGHTVDLWSAGVVLFVMVTGLMPYDERYPRKMVEKQMQHRVTFPNHIELSDDVKQLIFAVLHLVPSKRLPYQEIIRSPWLASTPYRFRNAAVPK